MSNDGKVVVTQRAVVARINRKLAHQGEHLHASRGMQQVQDVGRFYVTQDGNVTTYVNGLETYARELGVLRGHEAMVVLP